MPSAESIPKTKMAEVHPGAGLARRKFPELAKHVIPTLRVKAGWKHPGIRVEPRIPSPLGSEDIRFFLSFAFWMVGIRGLINGINKRN